MLDEDCTVASARPDATSLMASVAEGKEANCAFGKVRRATASCEVPWSVAKRMFYAFRSSGFCTVEFGFRVDIDRRMERRYRREVAAQRAGRKVRDGLDHVAAARFQQREQPRRTCTP
jgi:hypothetical protein